MPGHALRIREGDRQNESDTGSFVCRLLCVWRSCATHSLDDNDRVFETGIGQRFARPLLSELFYVVRTHPAAEHDAVTPRGNFDFQIPHAAAGPIGYPLCDKIK